MSKKELIDAIVKQYLAGNLSVLAASRLIYINSPDITIIEYASILKFKDNRSYMEAIIKEYEALLADIY